jgi:hypothetical protein
LKLPHEIDSIADDPAPARGVPQDAPLSYPKDRRRAILLVILFCAAIWLAALLLYVF